MENAEPKPLRPVSVPHEHLIELAQKLHRGQLFTDRHVERIDDVPQVFMLLWLGAFEGWSKEEIMRIGLICEDLSKAGPLYVNGYPSFLSFQILNIEDADKMLAMARKLEEANDAVLESLK